MSSIGGILNTARGAIFAHQTAVQVASHNIANAGTPGYSRQRVELGPGTALHMPYGTLGTGVLVSDVSRVRDQFADTAVRREGGRAAGYAVRQQALGAVEDVFGEPSEMGIASTLDRFWGAWSDLANQPTSGPARSMVRQRGEEVASAFNQAAARLGGVADDLRTRADGTVTRVNQLASQIAAANADVARAEAGGHTAGDARDLRDRLVDELSGLGSVQAIPQRNGSYLVVMDGVNLVDGAASKALSAGMEGGRLVVRAGGDPVRFASEGSALGEMVRVHNEDIPAVREQLDQLAASVVERVNHLHRQGKTAAGDALNGVDDAALESGVDFFDPAGLGAATLSLSAAVRADGAVIAAARPTASGEGANRLALELAGLRDATGAVVVDGVAQGGFDSYYRGTIAGVAQKVASAENSVTVYDALSAQALTRRESVSGVSTDEELIRLMQAQQAYVAATRLVSAVDEMTQSLLSMV